MDANGRQIADELAWREMPRVPKNVMDFGKLLDTKAGKRFDGKLDCLIQYEDANYVIMGYRPKLTLEHKLILLKAKVRELERDIADKNEGYATSRRMGGRSPATATEKAAARRKYT
jgi:hypothetical protein